MTTPSHRILIAEDDERTRAALTVSLEAAGYEVVAVGDGQAAVARFQLSDRPIDLVVLDVLMPKLDGFQVCQALREISDVPIIIATVLGSSSDRVTGLEMGANDYVVKPFSTKELIARIRSILRRSPRRSNLGTDNRQQAKRAADSSDRPSSGARASGRSSGGHSSAGRPHQPMGKPVGKPMLRAGELTIDPAARRVFRGAKQLRLTEIEFRLLEFLASEPGRIFSRGEILQSLWGYDASSASDTKTVDVHISRLRIKLEEDTQNPQFIVTIRGRGYMFLVQR